MEGFHDCVSLLFLSTGFANRDPDLVIRWYRCVPFLFVWACQESVGFVIKCFGVRFCFVFLFLLSLCLASA
ncbi:hypothetical protein PCAR4_430002 [Paraburkholderia caribensis]|nr:hypothetical protein PCAR4_430002 [Paraburkholderia caribensis]